MEALIRYISTEKPEELRLLLSTYNLELNDIEEQIAATSELIHVHGVDFLEQLYALHPDTEYFTETESTCPLAKHIPAEVKDFYSGEYKTIKLVVTAILAYYLIKKL